MVVEWIILGLVVIFPPIAAYKGKSKQRDQLPNRSHFYLKDIAVSVILLTIFFVLKPSIYYPIDFSFIGKGINISEDVLFGIIPIFFIPFVLSFTHWNSNYPKDITAAKELFGYSVTYLPNKIKEFLVFMIYIITGVLFEEYLCRQIMFQSLNATLPFNGDLLVVASSLLFALGHFYQGWKGIVSNFVLGLILGKIFLLKEILIYPIILHLVLNLTIVVLAYRRLTDLKKIKQRSQIR